MGPLHRAVPVGVPADRDLADLARLTLVQGVPLLDEVARRLDRDQVVGERGERADRLLPRDGDADLDPGAGVDARVARDAGAIADHQALRGDQPHPRPDPHLVADLRTDESQ